MKNDQRGIIVVETIGAFIPLILLIVSILSLINIVTVQARVHYALTQAANTVSMYSYVLNITGGDKFFMAADENRNTLVADAETVTANINGLIGGIESLSPNQVVNSGEALADMGDNYSDQVSPEFILQSLLSLGASEAQSALFEQLLRPLIGRYLANGSLNGEQYLQSADVIGGLDGLSFYDFNLANFNQTLSNDSILINSDGDVVIIVSYEVEYKFGSLPLPFEPKLSIVQTVKTKAWLGGAGEGYAWPES